MPSSSIIVELPSEERGGWARLPGGEAWRPANFPARGQGGLGLKGFSGKIWGFLWVSEAGELSVGGGVVRGDLHCWRKWVVSAIAINMRERETERTRERADEC